MCRNFLSEKSKLLGNGKTVLRMDFRVVLFAEQSIIFRHIDKKRKVIITK